MIIIYTNIMAETKQLELKLMQTDYPDQEQLEQPQSKETLEWADHEYKQFGNAPKNPLSNLSLLIACPVSIALHIRASEILQIGIPQFLFYLSLVAFLINYLTIIRKYELMPYLPQHAYDMKLKKICICCLIAIVMSIFVGWNGSGGIVFAMAWESTRGNKLGAYGYILLIIISGSLLMQSNYSWFKLLEFIPGLLLGYINSILFTLKQSSFYAIGHQFLLMTMVICPMMFPGSHIISPSFFQYIIVVFLGVTFLATVISLIILMQNEKVAIVMGILSGILMVGTSHFHNNIDFIGALLILFGCGLLIKKQFIDLQY